MKTIQLGNHVTLRVPPDWSEQSIQNGKVLMSPPDGGSFSATVREFQKPTKPGLGSGPSSLQMLSMQVEQFRVPVREISPGRAFATHSLWIGEPGQEQECRAWHLVNQVGDWHHETLLFTYSPPQGGQMDAAIVALLDAEVPRCQFAREAKVSHPVAADDSTTESKPKPWWCFW